MRIELDQLRRAGDPVQKQAMWLAWRIGADIDTAEGRQLVADRMRRIVMGFDLPNRITRGQLSVTIGLSANEQDWQRRAGEWLVLYTDYAGPRATTTKPPTVDPGGLAPTEPEAPAMDPMIPPPPVDFPSDFPTSPTPMGPGGVMGPMGGDMVPYEPEFANTQVVQWILSNLDVVGTILLRYAPDALREMFSQSEDRVTVISQAETSAYIKTLPTYVQQALYQYRSGFAAPIDLSDQGEKVFLALKLSDQPYDVASMCSCACQK